MTRRFNFRHSRATLPLNQRKSVNRSRAHRDSLHVETLECRRTLSVTITPIGGFETGEFDEGAAEAAAFSVASQRTYIGNQSAVTGPRVMVLDGSDPSNLTLLHEIDTSDYGAPTSIATHGNLVAVAIPNGTDETLPGVVMFLNAFDNTGVPLLVVPVGPVPDYVTFTPDGTKVLTANEGQPGDTVDPEGSISVIDVSNGLGNATESKITFSKFNTHQNQLLANGVRFLPDRDPAQSFEPEYIAVHPNSNLAWVTLQENNAIAMVNLTAGKVNWVKGLGVKDHSQPANALDPSDRDGAIQIDTWPVEGLYQPDGITAFMSGGELYLATANEGDNFAGENARAGSLEWDDAAFPDEAELKSNTQLGRLNISQTFGDTDGDGDLDHLYSFGSRSFTIWSSDAEKVFDSGDDFEQITADAYPANFNASNTNNSFDDRSDDKGPEPTTVVVGEVAGSNYAFITIERTGGIMMYDVSQPQAPTFVEYVNTRDFNETPGPGTGGDLHPENLVFVPAHQSPTGEALLLVSYQVSGSVRIFEIASTDTAALAANVSAAAASFEGIGQRPSTSRSAQATDLAVATLGSGSSGRILDAHRTTEIDRSIDELLGEWNRRLRRRASGANVSDHSGSAPLLYTPPLHPSSHPSPRPRGGEARGGDSGQQHDQGDDC
jgi:hypothetical protein